MQFTPVPSQMRSQSAASNVTCSDGKITSGSARPKLIQLAVLGEKEVGKTSLIKRYLRNDFSHHYTHTHGGDISTVAVQANEIKIHVRIVDAAGHQAVRSLIKSLYRDVQGILVVFDVTREKTLHSIEAWLREIDQVNCTQPVVYLVGNKNDLVRHRKVPQEQAHCESYRLRLKYFETSAATGQNVHETFNSLLEDVLQQYSDLPRGISISYERVEPKDKPQSCCT